MVAMKRQSCTGSQAKALKGVELAHWREVNHGANNNVSGSTNGPLRGKCLRWLRETSVWVEKDGSIWFFARPSIHNLRAQVTPTAPVTLASFP